MVQWCHWKYKYHYDTVVKYHFDTVVINFGHDIETKLLSTIMTLGIKFSWLLGEPSSVEN